MKKSVVSLGLFLILFFSFISFASASIGDTVNTVLKELWGILEPIAKFLLGDVDAAGAGMAGELLFVKILIFIIMLAILYVAVESVPFLSEEDWIVWLVSVVGAILASRFLATQSFIELVWLPTGVLGISLVCLLPLIVYFFFVEKKLESSRVLRRIAWSLFVIVYLALAYIRWDYLNDSNISDHFVNFNLGWIYIATAALALISLLLDKTIQSSFNAVKAENLLSAQTSRVKMHLMEEFDKIRDNFNKNRIDKSEYKNLVENLIEKAEAQGLDSVAKSFKAYI